MQKEKKPVKNTVKIFFDSETYTTNDEVFPYLIGWVTSLHVNQFRWSKPPHIEFLAMLTALSQNYKLELWAHNAQYDLLALLPKVLLLIPNVKITFSRNVENKCFLSFKLRSPTINFVCHDTWVWNRCVSVDAYCKILKLPSKTSIDYNKTAVSFVGDRIMYTALGVEYNKHISGELEYLKGDVMAMPLIHAYIYDMKRETYAMLNRDIITRDPKTSASFTKDNFNYVLQDFLALANQPGLFDDVFRGVVSVDCYIEMHRSSIGGFSSYNNEEFSVENKRVRSYDINSAYPTHLSEALPYGELLLELPTEPHFEWIYCTVSELVWKPAYSCINTKFFPKKCISTKNNPNQKFYISREIFNLLNLTCNHNLKIITLKYQLTCVFFKKAIAKLYITKQTTKDPIIKACVKLILNSLYGKMLEKTYNSVQTYSSADKQWKTEYTPAAKIVIRGCLTGVYIINRARYMLIKTLIDEIDNGNTFLYCDTDSLKIIEKNPVKFHVDPDFLGAWKYEGEFTHYRNTKIVKKYFLFNKHTGKRQIKLSGIANASAHKIDKYLTNEQIWDIFDLNNNYYFLSSKNIRYPSKYGQICISPIDIMMNKALNKITHTLSFESDTIIITPYNDQKNSLSPV